MIGIGFLCIYWYKKGQYKLAIGILMGFIIYYLIFWFIHLWGLGEGMCSRYFFEIFGNCPENYLPPKSGI